MGYGGWLKWSLFTFVNSDKRLGSEYQRVTNVGKLWINNWGWAW